MKAVKRNIDAKTFKRITIIPTAAFCVVVGIWGFVGYKNYTLGAETKKAAFAKVSAFSMGFTQHDERMIRSRDLTARTISFLYGQELPATILQEFTGNILKHAGTNSSIAIVNADGKLTFPAKYTNVSIADRAHFKYHQTHASDDVFISQPIHSRILNRTLITFARRITNQDGSFGGIVSVGVSPDEFLTGYDTSAIGKNGFMGVVGTDGQYRAYRLGNGRVCTANIHIPDLLTSSSGQKLVSADVFPDKRARIVAWYKMPGYPLLTVAGVDVEEEFAATVAAQDGNINTAIYISIFITIAAFAGSAGLVLLGKRQRRNAASQDAYRTAVEASHDGFFVLEAVRDDQEKVVDFVCIDSNAKAAALIGFPDKGMINKCITDIFPGDFGARLTRGYAKIMRGNITVDKRAVFIRYDCALQNKWVDYRVVPYQNGVTITVLDVTEEKTSSDYAEWQKVHDAVTSLPNRQGFQKEMPEVLGRATVEGMKVALFVVDVDNFKVVNDTFGHAKGDALLKIISERLVALTSPNDLVCRLGADEFALAVIGNLTCEAIAEFANKILHTLSQPVYLGDKQAVVSASVGVSVYPDQGVDSSQLLQYADLAMVSAKEAGKNAFRYFEEELYAQADHRISLEQDLRVALARNELYLLYQPKIDLSTNCIVGMEALIRWQSPTRGMVSPLDFISAAEKTGLILPIGNFVIEEACRQIVAWRNEGRTPLPVSVNISPKQLKKGDLVDIIHQALTTHDVSSELLQIELTESSMMDDVVSSQSQLQAIKTLGVKILVDDFGTGYSSLALLKKFEVDVLKVDRSFVKDIPEDQEDCAILEAIVSMANALHMEVVAEGVETAEQVSFLQKLGCESCQGFYYSKPISAKDMSNWLAADSSIS